MTLRFHFATLVALILTCSTALAQYAGPPDDQTGPHALPLPLADDWVFVRIPNEADPLTERSLVPYTDVDARRDYLLRVSGAPGTYTLKLDLRNIPEHDRFERALDWTITGTQAQRDTKSAWNYNLYATSQVGEPAVIYGGKTLWYMISAPRNGQVTINLESTSFEDFSSANALPSFSLQANHNAVQPTYALKKPLKTPFMTVWKGTNLAELRFHAENRIPNTNVGIHPYLFPNQFTFLVQERQTYFLRVDAVESEGEFRLTRSFRADAPNDDLAYAITLPPTPVQYDNGNRYLYSTHGYNFGATTESGEPVDQFGTVWYKLTAPIAGHLGIDISSTNKVFVYHSETNGSVSLQSLSRKSPPYTTEAGEVILLAISGAETEFDLNIDVTPTPNNDRRTNAIPLSESKRFLIYNRHSKADEPDDFAFDEVSNSLWWKLTPDGNGTLTVRSASGRFSEQFWRLVDWATKLKVDPASQSTGIKTFRLVAGKTYYFWFGVADEQVGEGELSFELLTVPSNDLFASPASLNNYTVIPYSNGEVRKYALDGRNNGSTEPGDTIGNSVWYRWVSPGNGYLQTLLSSPVPTLLVASGSNTASLTSLANPTPVTPQQEVVIGIGGSYDHYSLTADYRAKPTNDEATNAIPIVLGQDYKLYTRYAGLNPNDGAGASDIWFTYDPAQFAGELEFRLNPDSNGKPVALQFHQDDSLLASRTFTNRNETPLLINVTGTNLVTIRAIALQADTDFDLLAVYRAVNDNFTNRLRITLNPVTWTVDTPAAPVAMKHYVRRIVADNREATLEAEEPRLTLHDTATLSGKSLWWEFTSPDYGTLSIKSRAGGPPLSFHVTTNRITPTSVFDYQAWNVMKESQTVILQTVPGKTYVLRADTKLSYEGQLMDFDIMLIPYPHNDFIETAEQLNHVTVISETNYLGKYVYRPVLDTFTTTGSIYGGTRQALNRTVPAIIENVGFRAMQAAGITAELPAGQTIWYKVVVPESKVYRLSTRGSTFNPLVAVAQDDPRLFLMRVMPEDWDYYLEAGKTHYLLVDARVPAAAQTNSFGRLPQFAPNVRHGESTDINRASQDSIPGALNLSLSTLSRPQNDFLSGARPIRLEPEYSPGPNTGCGDYRSVFHGYGIEHNGQATVEPTPTAPNADDFPGGAGHSLWWSVTAPLGGTMKFDLSDSSCPTIAKVFLNGVLTNAPLVFSTNRFVITATAGKSYLVGVDSASGTGGFIVVNVTLDAPAPHNDRYANAREVVSRTTCGNLDHTTLEVGESLTGTGSIWYKWRNYSTESETVSFTLAAAPGKGLSLYRGDTLTNLVQVSSSMSNVTATATPGEVLSLRVHDTQFPPSGDVQIVMDTGANFYAGQFAITPSTTFTDSLKVEARSLSSARITFRYSTNGTMTVNSPLFESMTITDTTSAEFLVQFPDGPQFTVHRDYYRIPDVHLTGSRAFAGSLLVSLTNAAQGATIHYAIGDGNGNPPTSEPTLLFNGLVLTESAHVIVKVSQPGYSNFYLHGHYTNTAETPTFSWIDSQHGELATPTPQASLTVQQGDAVLGYATNRVIFSPDYPILQITASRPGWISAQSQIDLSQNYALDLAPLTVVTNAVSSDRVRLTLTDPNTNSYIWYVLALPSGVVSVHRATNTLVFDAPYSFSMTAFPASPTQNKRGPSTNIAFVARLLTPTIARNGEQIVIGNPNTGVQSTLWVNETPVGTSPVWEMPYDGEGIVTAFATSDIAETSPTNTLTVSYSPYLQVTPASATFTTNIVVKLDSSFGSRLRVTLHQEGTSRELYFASKSAEVVIDKPTEMTVRAERYGQVHSSSTNFFQGKVARPSLTLPLLYRDGAYSTLSTIHLRSDTTGAQFQYAIDFGLWNNVPEGQAFMSAGTHLYRFRAMRPYWQDSEVVNMELTVVDPELPLTNYVSRFWTILPTIPTRIFATNANLHSTPFVQFYHQVWREGGVPGPFIPLAVPVTNLLVHHRVVKVSELGTEYGPELSTYLNARHFDLTVDDPDSRLQIGPEVQELIYFYKPVWIKSDNSSITVQAVGDVAAYSLEPLRQGNRYLIPGNLLGRDRINLRYRISGGDWNSFFMRFKTLEPEQYVSATNNTEIVVRLDPNYAGHEAVGAFYETNLFNSAPNLSQPLPNILDLTNQVGRFQFNPSSTNVLYWINSKYILTNWMEMGAFPDLPVVPLN